MSLDSAVSSDVQCLMGLNTNLTVGDRVLHVQTEDLGRRRACIVTHVFSSEGRVIRKVRFDYAKHIDHPNLARILPRAMQAQHVAVMQRLRADGGEPQVNISMSDIPCVREEPTPEPTSLGTRPAKLRLDAGVWDRLVAQARMERDRQRAVTPVIPLPEANSTAMLVPTQQTERPSDQSSSRWEAAAASARREYEMTPAPASFSEDELAARRAFDEGEAHLRRSERQSALVAFCQAVALAPKNPTFRARLLRLLSRMEMTKLAE